MKKIIATAILAAMCSVSAFAPAVAGDTAKPSLRPAITEPFDLSKHGGTTEPRRDIDGDKLATVTVIGLALIGIAVAVAVGTGGGSK